MKPSSPMIFPRVTARNLEGRTVDIPAGLSGTYNLLVLAFKRDHQYPIKTWMPHFAKLESDYLGLEVWEVAALSRSYRIWRGAIDSGMRAGVPDPRARRHTLTAYVDVRGLQRALNLQDLDDIHLFLLGQSGSVRWQGDGAYNEVTLTALTAALRALTAPS
jgi:hypothetical protein